MFWFTDLCTVHIVRRPDAALAIFEANDNSDHVIARPKQSAYLEVYGSFNAQDADWSGAFTAKASLL